MGTLESEEDIFLCFQKRLSAWGGSVSNTIVLYSSPEPWTRFLLRADICMQVAWCSPGWKWTIYKVPSLWVSFLLSRHQCGPTYSVSTASHSCSSNHPDSCIKWSCVIIEDGESCLTRPCDFVPDIDKLQSALLDTEFILDLIHTVEAKVHKMANCHTRQLIIQPFCCKTPRSWTFCSLCYALIHKKS